MTTPKKNIALENKLPARLKNPTSVSLLRNLFDRFLSKDDSTPVQGWVGTNLQNSLYIKDPVLERRVNSLEPVLYAKQGTEEYVSTFSDIMSKLALMGVNLDDFAQWGQAQRFNFAPPIDLDKFINFGRYRWMGSSVAHTSSVAYNRDMDPEYYVIGWPVSAAKRKMPVRVASTADIQTLIGFKTIDGINLIRGDRVLLKDQAQLKDNGIYVVHGYDPQNPPRVQFSGSVDITVPGACKALNTVAKVDQGTGLIIGIELPESAGLGYSDAPIVSFIGGTSTGAAAKAIIDNNGTITGFTITNPGAAWIRSTDFDDKNLIVDDFGQPQKEIVKGALIPVTEGLVHGGTFWQLTSDNLVVDYDSLIFSEYGQRISDWTLNNYWVHENDVAASGIDINLTVQAIRPIIEYDFDLELNSAVDANGKPLCAQQHSVPGATLFTQRKTAFNQKPLFNIFTLDETATTDVGAPSGLVSSIFYYVEDQRYAIDPAMKRRIASPSTEAGDYMFEQGVVDASGRMYFFKVGDLCTSIWAPGAVDVPVRVNDDGVLFAGPVDNPNIIQAASMTPPRLGISAANIVLTGLHVLDGIALQANDRVMLVDQTNPSENGVYIVSAGIWMLDADATKNKIIHVIAGTNANTFWTLSEDGIYQQISYNGSEGEWRVPAQMFYNMEHENRKQLRFGDLRSHVSSILKQQDGFIGSSFGKNNARHINIDKGRGGSIRDYNSAFNLLAGLVSQKDISPMSIIDFAQYSYEMALDGALEFLNSQLIGLISSGKINPIDVLDPTNPNIINLLAVYEHGLSTRSDLTKVYGDSTSAITNWPVTLPYMGFEATEPVFKFDNELGIFVIVHHDGHESPAINIDEQFALRLTSGVVQRSDNQMIPGTVSNIAPANPYRNQLWYNTTEKQLYQFAVLSDTPVFAADIAETAGSEAVATYELNHPTAEDATLQLIRVNAVKSALASVKANLKNGDLHFDRSTSVMYIYDDVAGWTVVGSSYAIVQSAFKKLDLSDLYNSFLLAIEKKLYDGIPSYSEMQLNVLSYANAPERELSLATFAAKSRLDMYITDYNATSAFTAADAFTWNYAEARYSGAVAAEIGILPKFARWHTIYRNYFKSALHPNGTSRPNLEPWVLTNETEDDFRAAWPAGTFGSLPMWNYVKSIWMKPLCVRTTTNELLPPYMSSSDPANASVLGDILLTSIPPSINARYKLGDLGPVELAWERSLDYRYSLARVAFRKNPIDFLAKTWGTNTVTVNQYEVDKRECKKLSQRDILLHGELLTNNAQRSNAEIFTETPICAGDSIKLTLIAVSNLPTFTAFKLLSESGDAIDTIITGANCNITVNGTTISFKLDNLGCDFEKGDKITIEFDSVSQTVTSTFVPAIYKLFGGFAQTYAQLLRYNSLDATTSLDLTLLREWSVKLGHRLGGLINTDTLTIKTDTYTLHKSDFSHPLKINAYTTSSWLESLRIQLIRAGAQTIHNTPAGDGNDWVFRIEIYNFHNPELSYYTFRRDANFTTFNALGGQKTQLAWNNYHTKKDLVKTTMPLVITGIQNVVDFINGYALKLEEDGWAFNNDMYPTTDATTGRASGYQLEVEKFINSVYTGMLPGQGAIVNPFMNRVWINTPIGIVSEFKGSKFTDINSVPCSLDILGNVIPLNNMRLLRTDDTTEIISDVPIASVHAMTDSYEHVFVFNGYAADSASRTLLYDPFLGLRAKRIFIDGKKQRSYDGKPSLGGHYMKGSSVSENIETSVGKMLNYYSTDDVSGTTHTATAAQSLLGYTKKDYFTNIDAPDNSQFNFWKGLIHNKGSNVSIDAFLNSAKFKSAHIDEYWAYKLATYGDARPKTFPEIKLNAADTRNRFTVLKFSEYGETAPLYNDGTIYITPDDEKRWFSTDEISGHMYFEALAQNTITGIGTKNQIIVLPTISDCITGATLINSTTAKLDADGAYTIVCFGPAAPKFSPAKLIDYRNQALISDIPIWDPARGLHNPYAMEIIDVISAENPARYNVSTQVTSNDNYDPLRPWGKQQVGKVWWDTANREYLPYSDESFFPQMSDRLNRWGSLTDWGSIDVYEWVSSSVPPAEWATLVKEQSVDSEVTNDVKASGSPALTQLFVRSKKWKQRVVAWKYSAVPPDGHNFVAGTGQQRIVITGASVGSQVAMLNVDRFSTFGINAGSHLTTLDRLTQKPQGDGTFTGTAFFLIGKEDPALWSSSTLLSSSNGIDFLQVSPSTLGKVGSTIGPILMSTMIVDGIHSLTATSMLTSLSQTIEVEAHAAGTKIVFDFAVLGISISAMTTAAVSAAETAACFGTSQHDIYVREAMNLDIIIDFPPETTDLANPGMSNDPDDLLTYGFGVWTPPTPNQLANDLPAPNNRWLPVEGDWVDVDFSAALLDRIKLDSISPLLLPSKQKQLQFTFDWADWEKLQQVKANTRVMHHADEVTSTWDLIFPESATVNSNGNLDTRNLRIYIDGIETNMSKYRVNERTVTVNGPLRIGQIITGILRPYTPTAEELAFDPDVADDVKINTQFKRDDEYVADVHYDQDGNVTITTYYFWVRNKQFAATGKSMSVKVAAQLLSANTDPYLVLQDLRQESPEYEPVRNGYALGYDSSPYDLSGYDSNGIDLSPTGRMLPRRYTTAVVFGLTRQVTRDSTYKLRFTKNFTLRDNPNGVDLKNVHTEWITIRSLQSHKIPQKLWSLLIDAACGEDASGNIIPSLNRIDYDSSNGTSMRFGFAKDQALVDKTLALGTIKYTILNTALTYARPFDSARVSDVITVLDFSQSDSWFNDAVTTRQTLTRIWNEAKPTQINEIFFAVLNDALSNNYEFTDIFKTSMLSAYSIRVLQHELI